MGHIWSLSQILSHFTYIIFKDIKTIPISQAGQKQTVGPICPMGPYVTFIFSHIWNYYINSRSTCKNSKTWKSTAFVQTHNHDLERQMSPNCFLSDNGTLPRRKLRTRMVWSWWPREWGPSLLLFPCSGLPPLDSISILPLVYLS